MPGEEAYRAQIELELRALGVEATKKDVQNIVALLEKQKDKFEEIKGSVHRLIPFIAKTTQEYVKQNEQVEKTVRTQKAALSVLAGAYGQLDNTIKKVGVTLVGFASFGGLIAAAKSSTNLLKGFNNELLQSAAAANRYGIGIGQLETRLNSLGSQIKLTRQETLKLFQDYQRSSVVFSQSGFENMMKNVSSLVGPNISAIGEYVSGLNALVAKYPDLQESIERLNQGDKASLQLAANRLRSIDAISTAEYRMLQSYINQSKQVNAEDSKRQRAIVEQQKAFQELSMHTERIGLMLAQSVMPIVKEFSEWLSVNRPAITSFFTSFSSGVKTVVSAFKSLNEQGLTLNRILVGLAGVWALGKLVGMAPAIRASISLARGAASSLGMVGGGAAGGTTAAATAAAAGARAPGFLGSFMPSQVGSATARRAGMARGGAASLIGYAASTGLGFASDAVEDAGYSRGGAALGLGASLAGAAGAAGTGALIGSAILPGIGTTVGAIAGGVVGLVSNSSSIIGNIKTLIGVSSESKKKQEEEIKKAEAYKKQNAEVISRSLSEATREMQANAEKRESAIKTATDQAKQDLNMSGYASTVEQIRSLQEQQELLSKSINQRLASVSTVSSVGTTYNASSEGISNLEKDLENIGRQKEDAFLALNNDDLASDQRQLYADRIAQLGKIESELIEIKRKHEEIADEAYSSDAVYRNISVQLEANNAKMAVYNEQWTYQNTLLRMSAEYTQSQVAILDSLVQKSQAYGIQEIARVRDQYNLSMQAQQEEIENIDRVLELREKMNSGQYISNNELEKTNEYLRSIGIEGLEQLGFQKEQNQLLARRNSIEAQMAQLSNKIAEAYEGQLRYLGSQTSLMSNIVSLSDNFALGVGASAQMRMQLNETIEKEIQLLHMSKKEQEDILSKDSNNLVARTKMLQLENEIVSKRQQQAQQLKVLRDGWISALGAMNTGAGRFTKIMISQEQNLGVALRRFQMLTSSVSGSLKQGWDQSTKFSGLSQGELVNKQSGTAYDTYLGSADNQIAFALERMTRDASLNQMNQFLQMRNQNALAGGAAVGATLIDQKYALSTYLGQNAQKLNESEGNQALMKQAGFSSAQELSQAVQQGNEKAMQTASQIYQMDGGSSSPVVSKLSEILDFLKSGNLGSVVYKAQGSASQAASSGSQGSASQAASSQGSVSTSNPAVATFRSSGNLDFTTETAAMMPNNLGFMSQDAFGKSHRLLDIEDEIAKLSALEKDLQQKLKAQFERSNDSFYKMNLDTYGETGLERDIQSGIQNYSMHLSNLSEKREALLQEKSGIESQYPGLQTPSEILRSRSALKTKAFVAGFDVYNKARQFMSSGKDYFMDVVSPFGEAKPVVGESTPKIPDFMKERYERVSGQKTRFAAQMSQYENDMSPLGRARYDRAKTGFNNMSMFEERILNTSGAVNERNARKASVDVGGININMQSPLDNEMIEEVLNEVRSRLQKVVSAFASGGYNSGGIEGRRNF